MKKISIIRKELYCKNWIPTFANTNSFYKIFMYHIHHWWQFEKISDQSKTKNRSSFRMSLIIILSYRALNIQMYILFKAQDKYNYFVIDMFGIWGNTKFLISSIRLQMKRKAFELSLFWNQQIVLMILIM